MRLQRQCVVMFLVVHIFPSHISTYPVVLNITTENGSGAIGLGVSSDSSPERQFQDCVCRDRSTCGMPYYVYHTYSESPSQIITAEHAANYSQATLFRCEYKQKTRNSQDYEVSCTKQLESICTSSPCTINIIIECQKRPNIVLSWESKQKPSVLSVTGVTVIDCCKTTPTTTEVTSMNTTPQSTTFTSAQTTADLTTTPFVKDSAITSVGILQFTLPTPDVITTNSTPSDTAHQQQETGDVTSLTSGQLIGIIVGTAVAAILITLLIMCIFWKLKIRREKNRRNEQTDSAMQVSGNLVETQGNDVNQYANEGSEKTSQTIAHVSPLVQSLESESHLTQPQGDYIYIDIKSVASSTPSTAITSPSPVVTANQMSTTAEVVSDMQDSEYSHLGTSKDRLENPYNWLDHRSRSTTMQPVIIPALPIDNHEHTRYLDTLYVHFKPANHHISHETEQAIGANENNSLYSHLGESKAQHENTYNSLHRINDQPITEPRFTQHNHTSNQNSEIKGESILSEDQKLDISPHSSKHTSMEIVDVAPSTYSEIIPTIEREISNESSHLKDTVNQANPASSSTGHLIPQEATSLKARNEINMTPGTVQGDEKNPNTEDEPGQAHANAVYSMHACPQEGNTNFSSEATEYANVA